MAITMEIENLQSHVVGMKRLAEMLSQYSYPVRMTDEEDIAVLKQREIVVDGYTIVVYFGIADYGGIVLNVLSLTSKYSPFLPFALLCKVAVAFLGNKELSFVECSKDRQKVYTWMTLVHKNGKPISNEYLSQAKPCSYNGLEFARVSGKEIAHAADQMPPGLAG